MRGADLRQRAVTHYEMLVAAERRVRHHGHIVLRAPWQKVTLNMAVIETVRHLVGRAAMAIWNTEQIFHLIRVEVGHTPSANLSRHA